MDFIQATNTPVSLKLAGSNYSVRFLNFRELAPISAWIEEHVPSPYARAAQALTQLRASGKAPDAATEELLLDHAVNQTLVWPPRVGSKPWFDALDGVEGGLVELVYTILSKTIPTFDRGKAQELADKMTTTEFLELVYMGVYGVRPKKVEDAVEPDPNLLEEATLAAAASGATMPPGPNWGVWRE